MRTLLLPLFPLALSLLTSCLYISDADMADRLDVDDDGWATDEVAGGRDCDDNDPSVHPRAVEQCGDKDDDCDGELHVDEIDHDEDGTSACNGDCDDADPLIGPHAQEVCDFDDLDEDCNGLAEDDDVEVSGGFSFFPDVDGDTFGDHDNPGVAFCDPPAGWVALAGDCDDSDAQTNPLMPERCDDADADEDCNGLADDEDFEAEGQFEAWPDADSDGIGDPGSSSQMWCEPPADWTTTPPT